MAVTLTWVSPKFGVGTTGGGMPAGLLSLNPDPPSVVTTGGTVTNAQWETVVLRGDTDRNNLFPQTQFDNFRVQAVFTGLCDGTSGGNPVTSPVTVLSYNITSNISSIITDAEDCWEAPDQWAVDSDYFEPPPLLPALASTLPTDGITPPTAGVTPGSYLRFYQVFNQYDYRYLPGDPSNLISETTPEQAGVNSDTGDNCESIPITPFSPTTDPDTKPEMPYNAIYNFMPDSRVYVTITYTVTVEWACGSPLPTTPLTDTLIIRQHIANGHFPPWSPGEYGSLARFYIDQSYFYNNPSNNRYGWSPGKWIAGT